MLGIAFAIVAAGGYGELLAVYALYQGNDQATTRRAVLLATMFLVILVAAGPPLAYLGRLFSMSQQRAAESFERKVQEHMQAAAAHTDPASQTSAHAQRRTRQNGHNLESEAIRRWPRGCAPAAWPNCARGRGGGPGRRATGGAVDQDVQHRAGRRPGREKVALVRLRLSKALLGAAETQVMAAEALHCTGSSSRPR